MGFCISIWILNIVVLTFALDNVIDEAFGGNEYFQQEMIEKYAEMVDKCANINLKIDNLQSTNIQLQSTNLQLTTKVDHLETEIRRENKEYVNQMQMIRKQNKDLTSKVNFLQKQNKDSLNLNPDIFVGYQQWSDYRNLKDMGKRILVSDPQYTHSLELKLQELNAKVDSLQQNLQSQITEGLQHSKHGNVYIRWGRTTCPHVNGTDLVYAGYSGGSWYNHVGTASNYLCMPKDPEFLTPQSLYPSDGGEGLVYGVEYDERNFNGDHFNHDAPCVVCRSERTAIMMIPARQHCDSGWTKEYAGFLVSGAYVQKAVTEYVCL